MPYGLRTNCIPTAKAAEAQAAGDVPRRTGESRPVNRVGTASPPHITLRLGPPDGPAPAGSGSRSDSSSRPASRARSASSSSSSATLTGRKKPQGVSKNKDKRSSSPATPRCLRIILRLGPVPTPIEEAHYKAAFERRQKCAEDAERFRNGTEEYKAEIRKWFWQKNAKEQRDHEREMSRLAVLEQQQKEEKRRANRWWEGDLGSVTTTGVRGWWSVKGTDTSTPESDMTVVTESPPSTTETAITSTSVRNSTEDQDEKGDWRPSNGVTTEEQCCSAETRARGRLDEEEVTRITEWVQGVRWGMGKNLWYARSGPSEELGGMTMDGPPQAMWRSRQIRAS